MPTSTTTTTTTTTTTASGKTTTCTTTAVNTGGGGGTAVRHSTPFLLLTLPANANRRCWTPAQAPEFFKAEYADAIMSFHFFLLLTLPANANRRCWTPAQAPEYFKSEYADATMSELSLPEYILTAMAKHPQDNVAFHCGASERSVTYGALREQVLKIAAGLKARGFQKGDVLACLLPNLPEYPALFLGATLAGGVCTSINPTYTVAEVTHQLSDANAKLVVTVDLFNATVQEARKELPNVEAVFIVGPEAPEGTELVVELLTSEPIDFAAACAAIDNNDLAALPYSSGTTGLSKGVMLTHRNIVGNLCQCLSTDKIIDCNPDDVILAVLPFFHIYGMVLLMFMPMIQGAKVVTMMKMDAPLFLKILLEHKVTLGFLAPPLVNFLAKHPAVTDEIVAGLCLRDVLCGAAPLGEELAQACVNRLGCTLRQGYGMTELSPVSHVAPPGSTKYGSIGKLVASMEMKIVKADGSLAGTGPGEEGEICVRGPNVMRGYLNNAAATADTIEADTGFLHTGDIGYIDVDGMCYVVDRLKELIKVQGYQVAPAELEALLQGMPGVGDCAVIGIPHERSGEVPKVFVVRAGGDVGAALTPESVTDFVKATLSSYKTPGAVEFIDAIPKAASGKILRRELRDREKAAAAAAEGVPPS